MTVRLRVAAADWRAHLRRVAAERPGLVPVAKGNGYGFGLDRLAAESQALGADTLAVGTGPEVAAVAAFTGQVVVLQPWRAFERAPNGCSATRAWCTPCPGSRICVTWYGPGAGPGYCWK